MRKEDSCFLISKIFDIEFLLLLSAILLSKRRTGILRQDMLKVCPIKTACVFIYAVRSRAIVPDHKFVMILCH